MLWHHMATPISQYTLYTTIEGNTNVLSIQSPSHSCKQHNYIIEIWDHLVTDSQSGTILDPLHILWHTGRVLNYQGLPVIFNFICYMWYNQFLWRESLYTGGRDTIFEQGSHDSMFTLGHRILPPLGNFCIAKDLLNQLYIVWLEKVTNDICNTSIYSALSNYTIRVIDTYWP